MKLNELMDLETIKGQVDKDEMRRRIVKGGSDPFGKMTKIIKDKSKKPEIKKED